MGRVLADVVRYAMLIVLMIIVGSAIGFIFENGVGPVIAGTALIILFGMR
jgi:hypothetical protein